MTQGDSIALGATEGVHKQSYMVVSSSGRAPSSVAPWVAPGDSIGQY